MFWRLRLIKKKELVFFTVKFTFYYFFKQTKQTPTFFVTDYKTNKGIACWYWQTRIVRFVSPYSWHLAEAWVPFTTVEWLGHLSCTFGQNPQRWHCSTISVTEKRKSQFVQFNLKDFTESKNNHLVSFYTIFLL